MLYRRIINSNTINNTVVMSKDDIFKDRTCCEMCIHDGHYFDPCDEGDATIIV